MENREVDEFRNVLAEELSVGPVGGVEEVWETFKMALGKVVYGMLQEERKVTG